MRFFFRGVYGGGMKCDPELIGPSARVAGFHHYRCRRIGCGIEAHNAYTLDKISWQTECRGNLRPEDGPEIIQCFIDGLGISYVLAKAKYIAWRSKGSPLNELPPGVPSPHLPPPIEGPGTELKKILAELSITQTAACQCEAMVSQMNVWGPDCREHCEEILTHLREAYDQASILTKLRAWGNAKMQGKPLTVEGLLDLAIERAAARKWVEGN
jgi:hypothetical protein